MSRQSNPNEAPSLRIRSEEGSKISTLNNNHELTIENPNAARTFLNHAWAVVPSKYMPNDDTLSLEDQLGPFIGALLDEYDTAGIDAKLVEGREHDVAVILTHIVNGHNRSHGRRARPDDMYPGAHRRALAFRAGQLVTRQVMSDEFYRDKVETVADFIRMLGDSSQASKNELVSLLLLFSGEARAQISKEKMKAAGQLIENIRQGLRSRVQKAAQSIETHLPLGESAAIYKDPYFADSLECFNQFLADPAARQPLEGKRRDEADAESLYFDDCIKYMLKKIYAPNT